MPFSFTARSACLPLHLLSSFIHPATHVQSQNLLLSSFLVVLFSNSPVTPGAWAEATPCNAGSALFQQLWIDPCKGGLAIYEVPRMQRGQLQSEDVDRTGDERCSSQTTGFLLFISVQRGGGVLPELSEVLQEMGFACDRLNLEFISLLGSVPSILRCFVQLMFKQYSSFVARESKTCGGPNRSGRQTPGSFQWCLLHF